MTVTYYKLLLVHKRDYIVRFTSSSTMNTTVLILLAFGMLPLISGRQIKPGKLPFSDGGQQNNNEQGNDDQQQSNNDQQGNDDHQQSNNDQQQGNDDQQQSNDDAQQSNINDLQLSYSDQLQSNNSKQLTLIKNCCYLGYDHFTFSRKTTESGLYLISNFCGKHYNAEAYCDTVNGRGGWLVVQRRYYGFVDFNRTWVEFEDGFGDLAGEFWYGLRPLHCLTGEAGWEMRMDLTLTGRPYKARIQYEQFKVASAQEKYKLTVGGFRGNYWDKMTELNGALFRLRTKIMTNMLIKTVVYMEDGGMTVMVPM